MKKYGRSIQLIAPKLLLTIALAIFSFYSVNAQINPPSMPDINLSPGSPQHVGNSAVDNILSVSCWDGPTPAFHFEAWGSTGVIPLIGPLGALVVDPDVVVFPGSVKFCIFYQANNDVYAEVWQYSGGTCTMIAGPVMLSNGMLPASGYPNIDQLENGAAFVWQQGQEIKGRYWDVTLGSITTAALGPEVLISQHFPAGNYGNRSPDVSIYDDGTDDIANIVFVSHDYSLSPTAEQVIIQRHDLNDFHAGLPVPGSGWTSILPLVSYPLNYYNPRIASPPIGLAANFEDCETVVLQTDATAGSSTIIGVNRFSGGTYNPSILNNAPTSLTPCYNSRPVVAYTGCDNILVEWEYDNAGGCLTGGLTGANVLGRRLFYNGTLADPGAYSMVNMTPDVMLRPAVAGRYMNMSGLNAYSTYTDGFDVFHKYSPCYTPNLRKKSETGLMNESLSSTIYPNPANRNATVELQLKEGQTALIRLVDVTGKEVLNTVTNQNKYLLETGSFAEGVYFVTTTINAEYSKTEKLIIRH